MGKKDGGQRTKGNTKPSSSARSAELLLQSNPFLTSGDGSEMAGSDFGSSVAPIFGLTSLNPEEEALIPSQVKTFYTFGQLKMIFVINNIISVENNEIVLK
jgi:hypothetical protein